MLTSRAKPALDACQFPTWKQPSVWTSHSLFYFNHTPWWSQGNMSLYFWWAPVSCWTTAPKSLCRLSCRAELKAGCRQPGEEQEVRVEGHLWGKWYRWREGWGKEDTGGRGFTELKEDGCGTSSLSWRSTWALNHSMLERYVHIYISPFDSLLKLVSSAHLSM